MRVREHQWTLSQSRRRYVARAGHSDLNAVRVRWKVRWDVSGSGGSYHVTTVAPRSRQWLVLRDGVEIGLSTVRGIFRPQSAIALPDDVPLADQVFLLWLMQDGIYRNARRAGAIGGAVGGAAGASIG